MNYAEQVRDFVVNRLLYGDADFLRDDTSFLESGTVDSTGMLELILFLEESFGVKVAPEEMVPENLDSINRVAKFVSSKLAAGAAVSAAAPEA